jgi:hypothetical protein
MNNKTKYTPESLNAIEKELSRLSGLMEQFQGDDHFEHDVNGLTVIESLIDQACEKLRQTRTALELEKAHNDLSVKWSDLGLPTFSGGKS